MSLQSLVEKEGWVVTTENGVSTVTAYGNTYPLVHPAAIYLKLFREEKNPELKYQFMKKINDFYWPQTLWHPWSERRFRAHCGGHKYITYAGGAATGKSYDAAKIALIFWLADPKHRTVIIASTTLSSLEARVWGYLTKFISTAALPIKADYLSGKPPKILYPEDKERGSQRIRDTIHGIFAVAAKQGESDVAIQNWIGRHPDRGIFIVVDEAPDCNINLLNSLPNLESGVEEFSCLAIGNSLDIFDLHGSLSTPKHGWESINPLIDNRWETTQKDGICLFFSCYESPAIQETDPVRKSLLSKFLITQEQIDEKKQKYGETSDAFFRFTLGFWRTGSTSNLVISKEFITKFGVREKAEWSGYFPLITVGSIDPAFSTGGDSCIFRMAILGQDVHGQMVLDFRNEDLLFPIAISASSGEAAEVQIANQVIKLSRSYGCKLADICIDANGQGRALAEVLKLTAKELVAPIKIYSTRSGTNVVKSFDVVLKTAYELWYSMRSFIQEGQIKGLDFQAVQQFTTRLIIQNPKTHKQVLEPKKDYKIRMRSISASMAHSPDEADAAALCLQSAIINYGFTPGARRELYKAKSFEEEKFLAFLAGKRMPELEGRDAPPIADFTGQLHDIKTGLV